MVLALGPIEEVLRIPGLTDERINTGDVQRVPTPRRASLPLLRPGGIALQWASRFDRDILAGIGKFLQIRSGHDNVVVINDPAVLA